MRFCTIHTLYSIATCGPWYARRRRQFKAHNLTKGMVVLRRIRFANSDQLYHCTPDSSDPTRESGDSMGRMRTPRCSPYRNQATDSLLTYIIHLKTAHETNTLSSEICE